MKVTLGIVIPCYNEEEILPETASRMLDLLKRLMQSNKIAQTSTIYFVDDGSKDQTWSIIEDLALQSQNIAGVKLSRNQGQQNALLAGLLLAEGDALISVDADLQDDINIIEKMIEYYLNGTDIVYGVRKNRESDTFFKRFTARAFYRLMAFMGAETVHDHADFRLMSRRAIEALKQFSEINLFLRNVVPLIGYKSSIVSYDRTERFVGKSKYPLRKMVSLALDAITSFSVVPLRLIALTGFAVFLMAILMSIWALWIKFCTDRAVPGWTSVALPLFLLGGIQILCLGIMGEYLGKIYAETKARPRYFIEKVIGHRLGRDHSV
jgi:glycosyltransferase involved in cell wall biosynthesis